MNQVNNEDNMIFQFLEDQLPMQEKEKLEARLKSNEALRLRFFELKLIHNKLKQAALESPSSNFTSQVMRNLETLSSPIRLSPKNGLMLLLGVGIATMFGVYMLSAGWLDQLTGVITLDQFQLPKTLIKQPLPSIPFHGGLIMKVLIGLNLAIAFVLFDKTVLQPLFRNRARKA